MKDIPTDMQELLQRFDDWKLSTMIGEPDFDRYRGKPPHFGGLRLRSNGQGGFTVEATQLPGRALDDPDALRLLSFLDFFRTEKRKRYEKHLRDGYTGLKCVAEGDSWFELPPIGYASDIIRELWESHAILSLARAGDAWSNILAQDELMYTIAEEKPDVVLLSVSGNDILGDVPHFVHDWSPQRPVDDYVNEEFDYTLNAIAFYTEYWATRIIATGCHLVMHGYSYCDPRQASDGGWLIGGPLSRERNINDRTIWRKVVAQMVDRFNDRLIDIAGKPKFAGRFHFLDVRQDLGTGPDWWEDEVHPTGKGFNALGKRVRKALDDIAAGRATS
jgi:lysophospholipase L1-like esterase